MSAEGFLESFTSSGEDGSALANTVTATSIIPGARKITLPTGFFDHIGQKIKVRAAGRISTLITTPGTLTLDIRLGSVIVFNGGAMTLNIVSKTNVGWIFDAELVCRALGSGTSANLLGQGSWQSEAVIGSAAPTTGGASSHILPYNTAPVAGTGFDSSASQTLDLFGTWSVASASNSITVHSFSVESAT